MENDVLEYLNEIGYNGPLKECEPLEKALTLGVKDGSFRNLVQWLCQQLSNLVHLDETVGDVTDSQISSFVMELSSLLKELNCPYEDLVNVPVIERFVNREPSLRLLLFLISELMAAKMIRVNQPESVPDIKIKESDAAKDLKSILLTLKFPRPPDDISAEQLFLKVEKRLKDVISSAPAELVGKPLLVGRLSADQWKTLSEVQAELYQEYKLRREMLLKRLDVTITSFEWSDKIKGKENTLSQAFVAKRSALLEEPGVHLADVLAARQNLAVVEKTSSAAARKNTQSAVHKIIIGRVPDRGGRPSEQEAPPPEMPSWQKERAQGGGSGRGGGQFSRGGGRVQGGWSQREAKLDQDSRIGSQGEGGYDNRRGADYRGGHNERRGDRGHRGGGRGGRGRDNR